jgi:hypothetical protein
LKKNGWSSYTAGGRVIRRVDENWRGMASGIIEELGGS